jgi:hypothetical protein
MVPADILQRLPDGPPREKILLIDGLAADALDMADSAQGRLNNLAPIPPLATAIQTSRALALSLRPSRTGIRR